MRLEITTDMDLVKEIITSDYVWQYASDGTISKDQFIPKDGVHSFWLLVYKTDLCGIILVEIESGAAIKIHPYATESSKGAWFFMMKAFFKWYLDNTSSPQNKVNAKTPTYDAKLHELAIKLGFKDEGIDRESFIKDGKYYDQYIFGITRDEIMETVKWQQQSQQH